MKVSVPHGTTKALAIEKLRAVSPTLMARFGPEVSDLQQEWQEDSIIFSFKTQGFSVSGTIVVGADALELEAKLPLLARPFEGRIRDGVVQALSEIFGPGV